MNTLHLGPFAIAAERLLAIGALWAFVAVVKYGRRWTARKTTRSELIALAIGVVAARLGFVGKNWQAFAFEPWTVAYVWQGGFSPAFGITAAAVSLLLTLRGKALALAFAALVSVSSAWFAVDDFIEPRPVPLPPTLEVHRLDGRSVALDSLRGRPFVINLWATWCGPCRREMPVLVEVAAANPDVPILLINQGEDAKGVANFLTQEGLPGGKLLLDPRRSVGEALGSSALPTTAFVSSGGQVTDVHIGEISRAEIGIALKELRSTAPDP